MVKITRHSDPLNMRVAFTLNGVDDYGVQALIELLQSDVPIDRQTRDALADALKRTSGLRLQLVKEKPSRPYLARVSTWHEYQQIADEVAELERAGDVPKAAKSKVMERRGISLDKVKDALRYSRRARFRIEPKPRPGAANRD